MQVFEKENTKLQKALTKDIELLNLEINQLEESLNLAIVNNEPDLITRLVKQIREKDFEKANIKFIKDNTKYVEIR